MKAKTLFKITDWFRVILCPTWYFGYDIQRTMMLNPRIVIQLFIIPTICIEIGIKK
jgi:hypothetical protein